MKTWVGKKGSTKEIPVNLCSAGLAMTTEEVLPPAVR